MTGPTRNLRSWGIAFGAAALLSLAAGPAQADDYDPLAAGHPLRIVAYALHPIGVMIDYLLLRPAHAIGSTRFGSALFGHELHPHELDPRDPYRPPTRDPQNP